MLPTLRNRSISWFAAACISGVAAAQTGTYVTSGTGCPAASCSTNMIHQILPVGGYDLDGTSIVFHPAAPTYTALTGGQALVLTAAASPTGALDDSVDGPFPLGFTFAHQGGDGSTTAVDVDSNGYVYLEPGSVLLPRCCNGADGLVPFRSDSPSIAVLGTDLNPNTGGTVRYETLVANNPISAAIESVFVVEWQAVPEFPNFGANTVQAQLWQSGEIVIAHVQTNGLMASRTALVGVSIGGGQVECAGIDLSADLPFTPTAPFGQVTVPMTLSAVGPFALGRSITIEVDDVPSGASLGTLAFASGQTQLPLELIGFPPGCDLLVAETFYTAPMMVMAPTATLSVTVPNFSSIVGLVLQNQALIADLTQTGSFAIPVFVSNRGTLTVGQLLPGDECSTALPLTDGLTTGTNVGMTRSPLTGSCGNMQADVWYSYTATCTGTATLSFCPTSGASADFDTTLAVFDGACGNLTQIACNDDGCGFQSELSFATTFGTVYHVAIGGFRGATGNFTVSVACQ